MNPLDIGVVAVIVLSAIFAFARGFVREALSIIAWVGAAFITLRGFGAAFAAVDPIVKNPLLSQLIAGFGLFVLSLIVLTILTSVIGRYVRTSSLSAIDRTLGFIFGVARGVLIVCLAYLLLDAAIAKEDRPAWVQQAKSTRYLQEGADELKVFLPDQLKFRSAAAGDDVIKNIGTKGAEEFQRFMQPPPVQGSQPQPQNNQAAQQQPAATAAPDQTAQPASAAPGYKAGSRRQMDRLIQNNAQPR